MGGGRKEPILIVGSVAFDSVETPTGRAEMVLGGSASYAAIAASYFAQPQVVAVVGDDFQEHHLRKLRDHGVDTRGIEKVAGKTFHWKGRYHENMRNRDTLETALNVFESFSPSIPETYRGTKYVFLANIDPVLQLSTLEQVRDTAVVGMDTMNFWIETARDALREVLKRVDFLFIDDYEAMLISEERTALAAAERILEWGPKYLVVKRGEYGAVLFGLDPPLFVPAVLLSRVVDPTGAGDAFAGAFLGALTRGGPLDRSRANMAAALTWGTVVASFAVESFSVDGICGLSQQAIETRRQRLLGMVSY